VAPAVTHVGDTTVHWRRRLAYAVMIVYAILMFTPFAWSLITSFKTLPDSVRLTVVPDPPTFDAWAYVFSNLQPSIFRLFLNSGAIALTITISNLILASLAGYAFARLRFPGREILFLVVLATLMIPDQLRLVPVYLIMNGLGLTRGFGQYIAIVLVMAIGGANIFLMRQYIRTGVPDELLDAARIDGSSEFGIFVRIIVPLSGTVLAVLGILTFLYRWNDYLLPLLVLNRQQMFTLPIGITNFIGEYQAEWSLVMAASLISIVPTVGLFLFFQRYFVSGIAMTGMKG
jgi:ABC-type glycerol-3-phosphate transport system permease component